MTSSVAELPKVTGTCPEFLTAAVRRAVRAGGSWQQTADRVVAALRGRLPGPDILSPAQLAGDPRGYQTHLVHAEPDGSFSIVVMVWLPGQATPVHDHLSWCCTAVLQGTEYEEVYRLVPAAPASAPAPGQEAGRGDYLQVIARNANPPGSVSGFAPPGDIHLVRNAGAATAVSMHVYGTDITRVGSSVRRVYDLPVR
ncbi:MAG TPA: cysteine dioxygenase family protein [Trebonia sp.]|nr:cysteine dioxygenase family protein [Trebonia sp.]